MESFIGKFAEISDLPKDEQIRLLELARYELAMENKFLSKWVAWFIGSMVFSFLVYFTAIIFFFKANIWFLPILVAVAVPFTQLLFHRFYSKKLHHCLLAITQQKNA